MKFVGYQSVNLFVAMAIYLKKMPDGTVSALGDMETVEYYGGYDLEVTNQQWREALCGAHLDDNGEIVLGPDTEKLCAIVRENRDARLLADCDKITALRLLEMSEDARTRWAEYRKALLDIPQTEGFPWDGKNVPWPTKPE